MLRFAKWTLIVLLALSVFGFFHYTLPQKDIVRIVGTENRRIDFGANSIFWAAPDTGTAAAASRDVFFIQTFRADGKPMVYRNEDTGWGWPPYFKLDSSNLQAEATNLVSTADTPAWVAITHYGWRNEFLTIFPNAVSLRPVDGPDVKFFPWVNVIILTTLAFLLFMLWRMLAQFRERMIEPAIDRANVALDEMDARADAARDRASGIWGRLRDWLSRIRRGR